MIHGWHNYSRGFMQTPPMGSGLPVCNWALTQKQPKFLLEAGRTVSDWVLVPVLQPRELFLSSNVLLLHYFISTRNCGVLNIISGLLFLHTCILLFLEIYMWRERLTSFIPPIPLPVHIDGLPSVWRSQKGPHRTCDLSRRTRSWVSDKNLVLL